MVSLSNHERSIRAAVTLNWDGWLIVDSYVKVTQWKAATANGLLPTRYSLRLESVALGQTTLWGFEVSLKVNLASTVSERW